MPLADVQIYALSIAGQKCWCEQSLPGCGYLDNRAFLPPPSLGLLEAAEMAVSAGVQILVSQPIQSPSLNSTERYLQ